MVVHSPQILASGEKASTTAPNEIESETWKWCLRCRRQNLYSLSQFLLSPVSLSISWPSFWDIWWGYNWFTQHVFMLMFSCPVPDIYRVEDIHLCGRCFVYVFSIPSQTENMVRLTLISVACDYVDVFPSPLRHTSWGQYWIMRHVFPSPQRHFIKMRIILSHAACVRVDVFPSPLKH